MNLITITRRVEFDAGHRIPNHKSKCKHLHGHRYVLEATVTGPIQDIKGASDEGMIVDFADLKSVMLDRVAEVWDHGFLIYERDRLYEVLSDDFEFGSSKLIALPFVPTAENLAQHAFNLMEQAFSTSPFQLVHVRLYETPNGWADIHKKAV